MRQNTFANTLTRGLRLLLSAALLAGLALALRPAPVAQADTFTVDSTGDGDDVAPGDGTCADAGGNCTLRAAIMESNALAAGAPHTIAFNVGGGGVQTISPGSALPMIARPVTIDGTTQPGYAGSPIIELDGSGAGAGADGLHIVAGNSTVRGLVIHSFDAVGVALRVGGGNFIEGNYIGTDATGTVDLGNSAHGVIIWSAPDNTVGGMTAAQRNVISGNNQLGVYILGSDATGNQVLGNYIGTAATGTADLGNTLDGVHIHDAPDNTIGGTAAGAGNVISGNDFDGVVISSNGATGNQVLGNYIGTDAGGSADLGNTRDGVCIEEAPGNTIGGTAAGARTVISGNDWYGVWMRGSGATGNQVLGNYIGTDAGGSADLGNSFDGVYILEATDNTIGGTAAGAGNVISGNDF
ncbi:MAG: CSLREA domain-containing protein, partial [Anaerolineae bacterium]